ncbi:hypothetical protein MRB56_12600 [Halomonas cupida]|uniref:hypothetical protein n=1 Tax=Halomonas cupida TaxID=44933 RepID=UPI0039B3D789
MRRRFALCAAAVVLSGCASGPRIFWINEAGATRDAWYQDYRACAREHRVGTASSPVPREQNGPTPLGGVPSVRMMAIPYTGETRPEFAECMAATGWKLQDDT